MPSREWNRVNQGDCVEGLSQLEAGSIDLAFADPPFNIGYDYDVYDDKADAEHYLDWTRKWGRAVQRVLKPTGTFWLAIGDEYAAELKLIFQKELGFTCRSWVIWYYTFGVNCTKKFSRSHAHLFHFVKDPKRFTFNSFDIRVPSARQLVYADARADSRGRLPDDTWILRPQDLPEGFQPDEDTWYFSRVCGTFKERAGWHGCQMPEQLLGRIIRACSNPGEVVVDPFAGSGTTLVVAKKLGRKWLGFELSEKYAAQGQARLDSASDGQPLEGAEEPKVSAPATPRGRKRKESVIEPTILRMRSEPGEIQRGIMEAFFAVRGEFPADRVIADPDTNQAFVEACRRLGLPGQPSAWNRQLLNLRKAGRFKGLPRAPRTRLSREEIDRYGYACEIALQNVYDGGRTLDGVLCDPDTAAQFDKYVGSMIPEKISSFRIRWIALHIRKGAKVIRLAGSKVDAHGLWPSRRQAISSFDWDAVPSLPGLYWVESPSKRLYVGETFDLGQRFKLQFGASQFGFWETERQSLNIRYCALPESEEMALKGNQSWWISHWRPLGNFSRFAAI
jgi:site-specific DNA-methyltransferase (adenine-specific)